MTSERKKMLNYKIGQRFKELIKEFDGKQEVTAKYLDYHTTSISRFCNGHEPLPDDAIEKVSQKWGIREEYIKCIDDFKTDADLLNSIEIQNSQEFLYQKAYLETLGLEIHLKYTLFCPMVSVYRYKDLLLPFMCEESVIQIEDNPDFSLPSKDFHRKHRGEDYVLYLKKPLTKEIEASIGTPTKNSTINSCYDSKFSSEGHFVIPATTSPIQTNCIFSVWFTVHYNGTFLGYYEIIDIQKVFKIIDAHTKSMIETLLVNETKIVSPSISTHSK